MTQLTLTDDQNKAIESFTQFLAKPNEPVFVLSGYSGTGKSTLIKYLIEVLPNIMKTMKLVSPNYPEYELNLTATTNKAAENFSQITNVETKTIQSHLGLVVQTDYQTRETKLVPRQFKEKHNQLLFIDEASYVDSSLLNWIFKIVKNSKIVFIGDPAQLTPVKSKGTPVFDAQFPGAKLSQVVRQAKGNPIVDLSTQFRETVNSGKFFSFSPDGQYIRYMDREKFDNAIKDEFTRIDWSSYDSKILAWTNKRVVDYNNTVSGLCNGRSNFQIGDYAVCNKYYQAEKKSIKTDQTVLITGISGKTKLHDVYGHYYELDHYVRAFCPDSLDDKKALEKKAKAVGDLSILDDLDTRWIDLRAMYACTINKSQGSTYDRVFIDLDDIKKCNSGDQIARMLYVAVSRARHQVFLTGDIC